MANEVNDDDVVELDIYEALELSNGMDKLGESNAAISMTIYSLNEGNGLDENTVMFGNTDNRFSYYGYSFVIESIFESSASFTIRRLTALIEEWVPNVGNEKYRKTHELHLLITPMVFGGHYIFDLKELMYATLYKDGDTKLWHLVLAFSAYPDDGSFDILEDPDVDIQDIRNTVDEELRAEDEALEAEYDRLRKEQEELAKEESMTEEFVRENFGSERFMESLKNDEEDDGDNDDDNGGNDKYNDPWMRIMRG